MAPIATYVFLDLETTGLPSQENNRTKITEISMVAVKRDHLLDTRPGASPRVQHKLTLCFNPGRLIQPEGTKVTGLCNDLLEHETNFNMQVFEMINNFLNVLSKPVCLIAQNGLSFDYPILKNHVEKLKVSLSEELICADCLYAFRDIMEARKKESEPAIEQPWEVNQVNNENCENMESIEQPCEVNQANNENGENTESIDAVDFLTAKNTLAMQLINESTPKSKKTSNAPNKNDRNRVSKARRKCFWGDGKKPTESYKLKDIYERLLNRPAVDAHRAENDCIIALECSVVLAKEFVAWVDENHCPFSDIKPMTIGVRLGLLVLTGALWGCSNPFIRQGTKGLRGVSARTRLGQARAEIAFLLGNWRYVVPWLVNQMGSLAYLLAVQRAPLSLAVPAANGLAFAFTALTGAAVGAEEPLDNGSILGILFIVAGTALCCWDKTE